MRGFPSVFSVYCERGERAEKVCRRVSYGERGFSLLDLGLCVSGARPWGCERDLWQGGGPSLGSPRFGSFFFFFPKLSLFVSQASLGRAWPGVPKGTERRGAGVLRCGCPGVRVSQDCGCPGGAGGVGFAAGKRWRRNRVKTGETKPSAGKSGSGDRVHAEDTFSRRLAVYYSRGVTSKPLDLSEAGHGAGQQQNCAGSRRPRPSPRPRAVRAENPLREEKVGGKRGAEGIYEWVYFYFTTV